MRLTGAAARLWARRKSRSVWGATARSSLTCPKGERDGDCVINFPLGQNATDMQNSGTGAEIAARPLVDKNADTNKPSGIAAAVAAGKDKIAARPLSNLQKLDALFHLSQISDSL